MDPSGGWLLAEMMVGIVPTGLGGRAGDGDLGTEAGEGVLRKLGSIDRIDGGLGAAGVMDGKLGTSRAIKGGRGAAGVMDGKWMANWVPLEQRRVDWARPE